MSFTNQDKSYSAYSAITDYVVGDVVLYVNDLYICILASTANLPTDTTYWKLLYTDSDKNSASFTNNDKS